MSYVYRVLNAQDHRNYLLNKCFIAKKPIAGNTPLIDALAEASRHIFDGSHHDFGYISVSRSYPTIMEKYSFARQRPGFNEESPLVAIITGNDEVTKKLRCSSPRPLVSHVQKLVIDYSDDEHYPKSMQLGLIYSAKKVPYNYSKPKMSPGYKYARKSQELVILNAISSEDIKYILNPLEIDLLYAILKATPNADIDTVLKTFSLIEGDFLDNLMTYEEYYYFRYLYIYNHFLKGLIPDETREVKMPDALELTAVLKEIKRGILTKILAKLDFDFPFIAIVEDYVWPIRKGEINLKRKLDTFALYDDFHVPLDVPELASQGSLIKDTLDFDFYRVYDYPGDDYYVLDGQNRVLKLEGNITRAIAKKKQKKKAS